MKANRIILLLWLVIVAALVVRAGLRSSEEVPADQVFAGVEAAQHIAPSPAPETPQIVVAPVATEEPKRPVQSLEERGDAMLFEGAALQGTPFDEAVVMPFE